MATKKQIYTLEFKEKAIVLAEKVGISATTRRENVTRKMIRGWRKIMTICGNSSGAQAGTTSIFLAVEEKNFLSH